jgi:hypothetical protein
VAEPCQILIFGCSGWGCTSASVSGVFLVDGTPSGGVQHRQQGDPGEQPDPGGQRGQVAEHYRG